MPVRVIVTKDFDHMSAVAAEIVTKTLAQVHLAKTEAVLGLATGSSPTGLYRLLAKAANAGEFDSARVASFNLDEYIGLPGDNAQARGPASRELLVLHDPGVLRPPREEVP